MQVVGHLPIPDMDYYLILLTIQTKQQTDKNPLWMLKQLTKKVSFNMCIYK